MDTILTQVILFITSYFGLFSLCKDQKQAWQCDEIWNLCSAVFERPVWPDWAIMKRYWWHSFFKKNGPTPASFSFIFSFLIKYYNFTTNQYEKCFCSRVITHPQGKKLKRLFKRHFLTLFRFSRRQFDVRRSLAPSLFRTLRRRAAHLPQKLVQGPML